MSFSAFLPGYRCGEWPALKAVLSFAVGGLLGDVFLHLLPEAWGSPHCGHLSMGLWVLAGLLSFLLVEKVAKSTEAGKSTVTPQATTQTHLTVKTNGVVPNGTTQANGVATTPNGTMKGSELEEQTSSPAAEVCSGTCPQSLLLWLGKDVSGYLNLVANCTDNFTHGLAIAASYVASPAVGLLTTMAILCHEIPHEIGDFAILLNSGFSTREAAWAQMVTACGGLVGVVAGLTAEHLSSSASWLLPFTAGGFLYIALVSIIPELLEQPGALLQLGGVVLGVVVMALVTIVEKKSCSYMPPVHEHSHFNLSSL